MRRHRQHVRPPQQSRVAKGAAELVLIAVTRASNKTSSGTTPETQAAITTAGAVTTAIAPAEVARPSPRLPRLLQIPNPGNLRFDDVASSQPIPAYNMETIEAYTAFSIPGAQCARRQAMNHWRARAAALPPHNPSETFHSALVEKMDRDLDLFDRGDACFQVPLNVFDPVRSGAEVTGVIAYDQASTNKADPGPLPMPLDHLCDQQDTYWR